MTTKRQNKFIYLYVIQYRWQAGAAWEDVEETEDLKEARYLLKESRMAYRGNGSVRMINRRIKQ